MMGLSVGFNGYTIDNIEVTAISKNEAMANSYNTMLAESTENGFSTGSVANMMSSYVTDKPTFAMVQFQNGAIVTEKALQTPSFTPTSYANIRPVITIFKTAN